MAQLAGPVNQRVVGSILGWGKCGRQPIDVSLSLTQKKYTRQVGPLYTPFCFSYLQERNYFSFQRVLNS